MAKTQRPRVNRILKLAVGVRGITDDEIKQLRDAAQEQLDFMHPLKLATQARENKLGAFNMAVIQKFEELRSLIKKGPYL